MASSCRWDCRTKHFETNAIAVHDNNNEIRQWASKNGCEIITKHRTIGTSFELISKVVVPDESIACVWLVVRWRRNIAKRTAA